MPISNTSIEAYKSIFEDLGKRQQEVYHVILEHQPIDNERIASLLGYEINRITGRVNELYKKGLIKQDGFLKTKSGRKAKAWVINQKTVDDDLGKSIEQIKASQPTALFDMDKYINKETRKWEH